MVKFRRPKSEPRRVKFLLGLLFDIGAAPLRHELSEDYVYEFVQGTVQWPMDPGRVHFFLAHSIGRSCWSPFVAAFRLQPPVRSSPDRSLPQTDHGTELKDISDPKRAHYAYYDFTPESAVSAVKAVNQYVKSEGPFEGIIGFSQGASLAVMYLANWVHENPTSPLPVSCAILFSQIATYNHMKWLETGELIPLDRLPGGLRFNIPAIAVWGASDREDVKNQALLLDQLFDEGTFSTFVHSGGHEVPGAGFKAELKTVSKLVQRVVTQTQLK